MKNKIDGEDLAQLARMDERPNFLHRCGETVRQVDLEQTVRAPRRCNGGCNLDGIPAKRFLAKDGEPSFECYKRLRRMLRARGGNDDPIQVELEQFFERFCHCSLRGAF